MPEYSDTPVSEADAVKQQERIKEIMAETGLNFDAACSMYIKEKTDENIVSTAHSMVASHGSGDGG